MQVLFKKITSNAITFETKQDAIKFFGTAKRDSKDLVTCRAKLQGKVTHICDRCGEDFDLILDEELELLVCDGVYAKSDSLDVIEFYEGVLDFDALLMSELEAIKSGYNYCKQCSVPNV
ncbi:MAG: DNA-binding protein [Sulfurospirillum sp.]|nr:DNA-binding protein [Sulfurospirillum sp.]